MELTSILNIEPIGHRKRIMKSIRDLRTLQSSYDEAEKRVKNTSLPPFIPKKSIPTICAIHVLDNLRRVSFIDCHNDQGMNLGIRS